MSLSIKNIAMPLILKTTFFVLIASLILLVGCKDDDDTIEPGVDPNNPNAYVNDWIKSEMDFWYFWNDEIPENTNNTLSPSDYFYSILSNKDRFSWIQPDYLELLASLRGVSTQPGYELRYLRDADSLDLLFGQILYVKHFSPAAALGLKRGDLITHINGTRINVNNFQSLNSLRNTPHNFSLRRYAEDGETFENLGPFDINPVEFSENPNFLDTIYQINGKKIGYFVYNSFTAGPTANSTVYSDELDDIFTKFRNANVDEFILDMRYNGGGSLDVSIQLGSLLAKGVTANDIFSIRKYNEPLEEAIRSSADLGPSFLENKFVTKFQNIGNRIDKVYILTGNRTASASEIVINGIKPFTPVFMIGDSTVGKNQGSITLYEEDDPDNTYGMQPIILFIANGLGESDFIEGFAPDIYNRDVSRQLFPLGDVRETLLNLAIEQITGTGPARIRPSISQEGGQAYDLKRPDASVWLDDDVTTQTLEKLKHH